MKKRVITVTVTYDMSAFQENIITPKEKVKKMITKDMIEKFGWDEGFSDVKVDVKDIQ